MTKGSMTLDSTHRGGQHHFMHIIIPPPQNVNSEKMRLYSGRRITSIVLSCMFCLFLVSRESEWMKMYAEYAWRAESSPRVETAAVILTAGRHDETRFDHFILMMVSFRKLSVTPDLVILFQDWNADPTYAEIFQGAALNLPFPTKVVSRPLLNDDNTVLYPAHFYKGHLKLLWWWTMNTAFVTTGAEQICYFEDDLAIHPDFFKWVKEMRTKIPRKKYWGLYAMGGAPYTPMCIDRYEWSLLLYYYQDFCLKEQGNWDMLLYGLHQNGPIPKNRAETTTESAIHLSYCCEGNVTSRISKMNELFSQELSVDEYQLETPSYGGRHEPAIFADLNFESFVDTYEEIRAITQTQLLKIIDYCTGLAKDTRLKLQVDKRLTPIHMYNKRQGMDLASNNLASIHDNDIHLNQSRNICNKNADCMGFVHSSRTKETWFKSNVSFELLRNPGKRKKMTLYTKICERISGRNLCIPAFNYAD